jgi:hypothetical protein
MVCPTASAAKLFVVLILGDPVAVVTDAIVVSAVSSIASTKGSEEA